MWIARQPHHRRSDLQPPSADLLTLDPPACELVASAAAAATSLVSRRRHLLRDQRGFTVVELLIVIVVIGVLAAIALVGYNGVRDRAQAAAAQSAASQAGKKVVVYAVENSDTYPATLAGAGITASGDTTYQYSVNNSVTPKTFCVTATTQNASYYISSTNSTPTSGACPGHGVGGVAAVTNQFMNPHFNGPAGPVANGGLSSATIASCAGSLAARAVSNVSSNAAMLLTTHERRWSISSDQSVYARATVRNEAVSDRTFRVALRFYDTAGTTEGATLPSVQGTAIVVGAGMTAELTAQGISPSSTASVALIASRMANGAAVGDAFCVDDVFLSDTVASFADGDSHGWVWNGTPNDSTSTGPPL